MISLSPEIFTVSLAYEPLLDQVTCHPSLCVSVDAPRLPTARLGRPTFIRNIGRCNLESVKFELQLGAIRLNYDSKNGNLHFTSFSRQLSDLIKSHSPWKCVGRFIFPKRVSKELKELVILKKTLHKKMSLGVNDYHNICIVRNRCRAVSRDCRSSYISHVNSI